MNAKDRASQNATKKGKKYAGNVKTARPTKPKVEGLTGYDELLSGYERGYTVTPSGMTFEIQAINPGMFLGIFGTPFMSLLIEKGATDQKSIDAITDNMTDEEKIELANEPILKGKVLDIICAGVISAKLVNKPQSECDPENKELSIIRLIEIGKLTSVSTPEDVKDDVTHLYKAIQELTKPEEIAKAAESFLKTYKEGTEGTTEDTPDSEGIPSDTESDTVPEDTE